MADIKVLIAEKDSVEYAEPREHAIVSSDVPEGTNLYYTNTRADARITAQKGFADGIATLDGSVKIPIAQIPTAAVSTIGTSNTEGSATSVARSDHVHDHGSQTTGTHHAAVTTSVNGFMLNTDKTKMDALLVKKAGVVSSGSFTGNPKKSTITFTTNFSDTSYSILIVGLDARSWTYETKTTSGFTINANSNQSLTGEVSWQAIQFGEAN